MISSKHSPRNQWNVSSMTSGDRFSQRSSMSMATNSRRKEEFSALARLACGVIASSVEYSRKPCRCAMRRAVTDLPAPLPPPIQ